MRLGNTCFLFQFGMSVSFSSRAYCVITGASRGYGRCLAVSFAQAFSTSGSPHVDLVLTARNREGLEETKRLVLTVTAGVNVYLVIGDMQDLSKLDELCSRLLQPSSGKKYEQTILVNNAGSLGDVTKPLEKFSNPVELQTYFGLNLTSPVVLTGKFIQEFRETSTAVINISSLCAVEPVSSMGVYCIGKAARDMALRVYAKEQADVLFLNYAPGPMETAMSDTLASQMFDEKTRDVFQKMKDEKTFVPVEESVRKLIGLLRSGEIQSGLEETKRIVLSVAAGVNVYLVVGDMHDLIKLDELCSRLLQPSSGKKYEQTILINNAGSMGDVSKPLGNFINPVELQTYFGFNLTSPMVLTGKFIQQFRETSTAVINVSSRCAVEPFPSLGVYCIGKAARDMALRVYAKEQADVLFLNYSPGPMETVMYDTLAAETFDEKTRDGIRKMKDEKKFVPVEESARKLIGLLRSGGIQSGAYIDFYDPAPSDKEAE